MFKPISIKRPYTMSVQYRSHSTVMIFPQRFVRDELELNPGDYTVFTFGYDDEENRLGFRLVEQGDDSFEFKRVKVNPAGALPVSITSIAKQVEIKSGSHEILKSDDGYWYIQL